MQTQQVKGAVDTAEHAKRQHIHLEQPQSIKIILVPFNNGAPLHCRRADRTEMIKTAPGDDKTANMLREMSGKAADVSD